MNVRRLVLREIAHRKLNSLLALLSVSVAVACLVGADTLMDDHQYRTEQLLAAKQTELEQQLDQKRKDLEESLKAKQKAVEKAGKKSRDAMRKITKGLGFNILILPKNQDRLELKRDGTLTETMPEERVKKLAESSIVTVNHLLPMVLKKLEWPEKKTTIILAGTRGEVPIMHRSLKKPLRDRVPPGKMAVGFEIHKALGLKKGEEVTLKGKKFQVAELSSERGTTDDITVWINLREAQELLGMQNLINGILALECNCATVDRVAEIEKEILNILPGAQIIERGTIALARAKARNNAEAGAAAALKREKAAALETLQREKQEAVKTLDKVRNARDEVREDLEGLAAILVPLVIVGCAIWIGLLAFGNVRQRSSEIGILRAIGLQSSQILFIFLGKALLLGLIGSAIGYAAGFGIGLVWAESPASAETIARLFVPGMLLAAVLAAPLLSGLASWIPAMLAAGQDPAIVLQEE